MENSQPEQFRQALRPRHLNPGVSQSTNKIRETTQIAGINSFHGRRGRTDVRVIEFKITPFNDSNEIL